METEEIEEMTFVNRIPFPKWVERRKLIITGPPGCGKTTILNAIRGWPEEGYLNLASKDWWKAPTLAHRPREMHFGFPFAGFEKAVPVYDTDALDDSAYLEIDFFRILLPPPRTHPFSPDFRGKFIFEFILLPAEKTFALRKARAKSGTHHVDESLTLAKVREELHFYRQLAFFFHQNGMSVYVREDLGGTPRRFVETATRESKRSNKSGEGLYRHLDQIRLRERLLNRSWSIRGNKKLLELFVEVIPIVLDVERCSIFINDPATDKVWLQTGTGVEEKQIELDKSDSLVGQVIATGEYMVKEGMDRSDGPHRQVDARTGFVTRNELCVPIKSLSGNKSAGAILALNKRGGRHFREQDRAFLEKVAGHLQSAIESIYLRQELLDFSELLTHRARFSGWVEYLLWGAMALAVAEAAFILYLVGR